MSQDPCAAAVQHLDGLYVGQLTDEERTLLWQARDQGIARVEYNHPGGFFLGLGKVRVEP